jgi:hypothetical protein
MPDFRCCLLPLLIVKYSPPWIQCHWKICRWRHCPGDCHWRCPSHSRWPSLPPSRIRTPTIINNIGSYAPPPRWGSCGLQPLHCLHYCCCRGQRLGASNAAAAAATVVVIESRPRGRHMKDDALVIIFDVFQEDDESSASEEGMILH